MSDAQTKSRAKPSNAKYAAIVAAATCAGSLLLSAAYCPQSSFACSAGLGRLIATGVVAASVSFCLVSLHSWFRGGLVLGLTVGFVPVAFFYDAYLIGLGLINLIAGVIFGLAYSYFSVIALAKQP